MNYTPGKRGRPWRRARDAHLKAHPYCVVCRRPAEEVDHIRALVNGGALDDPRNLQSMCKPCHWAKTRATTPGYIRPKPRAKLDLPPPGTKPPGGKTPR